MQKHNFEVKYKVNCSNSNCKNVYVRSMDFVEQFLRQVLEA